jgi:peptide/nickel transport system substrate-binding protein
VDYGHRPVPLTYLNAALRGGGVWNAARYANKHFDGLINSFQSAASVKDQRKYARQIEMQLLKDTPVIYSYFYNFIAGASPKVHGYVPDGIAVVNLRGVTLA